MQRKENFQWLQPMLMMADQEKIKAVRQDQKITIIDQGKTVAEVREVKEIISLIKVPEKIQVPIIEENRIKEESPEADLIKEMASRTDLIIKIPEMEIPLTEDLDRHPGKVAMAIIKTAVLEDSRIGPVVIMVIIKIAIIIKMKMTAGKVKVLVVARE